MVMNKKISLLDPKEYKHQSILFDGRPATIVYESAIFRDRGKRVRGWEIKEINIDQSLNKK